MVGHAYERQMLDMLTFVQFEIMMRLLRNCSKLVVQHTEICQILPKVFYWYLGDISVQLRNGVGQRRVVPQQCLLYVHRPRSEHEEAFDC